MRRTFVPLVLSVGAFCASVAFADTTVRIATWNITNYSGGRVTYFQTAIYGEYQGRSMAPDIIFCQEMLSQTGVNAFLSLLNTAPNSPGDWAAAEFIDGRDTDNALFYRTSVVEMATDFSATGVTVVATGGRLSLPPARH
ncbi:hypothetical protein [uncultured Ilyobacter sp.]|uniref:hypothetical protein n=1 Tax=uncultured Ilyobacter sp. TaxID=544433 RepID=UPI0029F49C36|nr:hypothetical protein [uncultured Ilyobacter sp.]